MSMIDRYKKRGGFLQLVQLLETMGTEKREKFLSQISAETPLWESAIRQKMITLDRMIKWPIESLMEFIPNIPPLILAKAVFPMTPEKRAFFVNTLAFGGKKICEEFFKENHAPPPGEIASSQIKIMTEARASIVQGKLKLDKCDPELFIPENFEDLLLSGNYEAPVSIHAAPEVRESHSGPSFQTGSASVATSSASTGSPAAASHPGSHANMGPLSSSPDELLALRRKIVTLTQENQRLQKELNDSKARIEAVKIALAKPAA